MNRRSRNSGRNKPRGRSAPKSGARKNTRGSTSRSLSRRGRGKKQVSIDPSRFVNGGANPKEEVVFVPQHTFADFGLHDSVLANVISRGYEIPTPVQDGAIPIVLAGKDLIALANTGTGKTAAFVLPIIHRFLTSKNKERALVLAPTRELAVQIKEEFDAFAKGLGLHSVICVGGVGIGPQKAGLARGPEMIIATPGRLLDLINQKSAKLGNTTVLVLDEADRMLDMGFIKDINLIIDRLPKERQSLCLSATITPEIEKLLSGMLINPETVSVRKGETSEHVRQDIVKADTKERKFDLLKIMLGKMKNEKVLIFGRTKWGVQKLARLLTKSGFRAADIHGNRSQPQRQRAINDFKNGKVSILVATDVAARGLDIPNVAHVINFDEPNSYDDYVHRIGRTGRAGNSGRAFTFVGSH